MAIKKKSGGEGLLARLNEMCNEFDEYTLLQKKYKRLGKEYKFLQIFDYVQERIEEFVEIENPKNYISGVYFLGDFYVGKSKNIKKRISEHILDCIGKDRNPWDSTNLDKVEAIKDLFNVGVKLKVSVLDGDMEKEREYVNKLYVDNPLTNKNLIDKDTFELRAIKEYKSSFIKSTSLEYLMGELERIANLRYGGHYTIYKFTSHYKCIFYTIINYSEIEQLDSYKTLKMGIIKCLEEEYSRNPYPLE